MAVWDERLAVLGGPRAVGEAEGDLFAWPVVTAEDEAAVLAVLRAGSMSGWDVTREFEAEYAAYQGSEFALGFCNGTEALRAAMYACGVRRGDEIVCPSMTYWASALPAFSLGATVVFAEIDSETLCVAAADVDRRITERTKAIVVVHYCGHPCEMDAIMGVAKRRGVKVIEDVSHAHGGLYKGRKVGSFGDVAAMSMMAGKSLAIGEAGMLCTHDRAILEGAVAFAHYQRHGSYLTMEAFKSHAGLPLGGVKGRMNQTCAAMGRVQLKHYPARMAVIQRAMHRFWDLLEGVPGLRAHRAAVGSGSTMGGWYNPVGHYEPEALGGLPVERFLEAVNAEGARVGRGCNAPLHLHPVFNEADVYGDGRPTRVAFSGREVRQPAGSLPVTEALPDRCFGIPWFKHDRPASIERYAAAYKKVALRAEQLLDCGGS